MKLSHAVAILLVFTLGSATGGGDWPFFRGPGRDGHSQDTKAPLHWSKDQNILWKVKLPRPGNSSPIAIGQQILVTCAEDDKGHDRSLYCFDRKTGKQLWVQTIHYGPSESMHQTNPHCASTPASDGQRIVVWHGSAGLFCYDTSGKSLWKTDLGKFTQIWGYAASPVVLGDVVYLSCGPGVRQFVTAVRLADGKVLWKTDEPGGADDRLPQTKSWIGSWSSPVLVKTGDKQQLLVAMPRRVNAYDLASGAIAWSIEGTGDLAYTDVIVNREASGQSTLGAALAGFGGKAITFKLTPGMSGNVTASHRLWQSQGRNPQRIGSGVMIGQHLFFPNEPGLIQCMDVQTGKEMWSQKLPGHTFWASIISAAGRLYATSQKGTTFVFSPDPKGWNLLATNELSEHTNATPAISDGQIFVRTWENLYCVEEK